MHKVHSLHIRGHQQSLTSSPPQNQPLPNFLADVHCGQTAGWIKMALGMWMGRSPCHIVLDGDPASLPKQGADASSRFAEITQNNAITPFKVIQGHRSRYQSKAHIRFPISELQMWANAQRDGRPAEYEWRPLFNAAVWLTPTTRVPCSNAAKTRNPLKSPEAPQTNETISAASGPKSTIL